MGTVRDEGEAATEKAVAPILDSYEAYGCKVNAIGVDELFRRYEQAGFLYPAKMERLAPFMPLVKENWKKALRAGELIHFNVSVELSHGEWASISSWRSTQNGWNTQHLVGLGGPAASRAVMLATQATTLSDAHHGSHQNWFQRTNRFANKAFGSILEKIDGSIGWIGDYSYFMMRLSECPGSDPMAVCRIADGSDREIICQFATTTRSNVFSSAEGLDDDDLDLEGVDDLYRRVGLRRYRQIILAEVSGRTAIAALALVYRGPLGFNFSFLENRCDLIFDSSLSPIERDAAVRSLLAAVAGHYTDFPPQMIPIVVERSSAPSVASLGFEHVRDYAQSIWLRGAYEKWYRHLEHIYDRVIRAERRIGLGRKDAMEGKIR